MLLSLLQNNNNVVPATLPKVIVDRGGGGPSWPSFDVVDIQAAVASFVEVAGEHPVARAVRRQQHIGRHLESLRDARERREGAAFIAGAALAENVAQEKIDELRRQIEAMQAPKPEGRGAYDGVRLGIGGLLLIGAGVAIGVMIAKNASKKRAAATDTK